MIVIQSLTKKYGTFEEQFTIFGAYGAITFCALSGLLLHKVLPYRAATAGRRPAPTPPEATSAEATV